ncbi:MAG: MBL fold metallo-hydrolase [Candidatus Heimdallarchaeota archaeon]|nr:MBL fold metallo-hydrolase [Candidatus Heimdallarchaeota archaeon]
MEIRWLGNACLEIVASEKILIDPNFLVEPETDPELILITHEHDDHCDPNQVTDMITKAEIYGPKNTLKKFNLPGEAITPGEKIRNIQVLESDCWGAEESVSYYYQGLLHAGDSAHFPSIDNVKVIFTACFPDFYDDYIQAFKRLKPELVIPFHYDVSEDLSEAKGLLERLSEEEINGRLLSLGESIKI